MPVFAATARCRAANRRGFTLVELLVVMVLMGVIASFAVPRIGGFIYADRLKTTVRKLVGLIHRSAQMARQDQMPYLLTYKPGERLFVAAPEEPARGEKKDAAVGREERLTLADTVAVRDVWSWFGGLQAGDTMGIRFNKNGYVEPTIIHLRQEDGQEMSVILTPFLGKVKVEEGYAPPETQALFQ
ncbi:MAG: prepilin-type N-terminal cleavage/methylation domain-containing protein [Desulfobulbus sp.]|jgi:general secretion pathway protein H|uniref:prepilin-type N-terminal cleavage/methylation domain-containing protein n=1 Tax=Desulfobulbus sp. TaxID=895 RepID=UPI00283E2F98|nr:prepilin-type N-terminal cleavage/methylation domain-containing protein [Desulfobulbus sp.]MDR2548860.1 prepilin-type N-terminal cleavage/methylation domain-containing protein [Desulfobulbus sp.]